jgi:uncharacterized protein (UPF0276 family)
MMKKMSPESQLPARGGVGLKPVHYHTILEDQPNMGFFEIHAENYMGAGGPPHRYLTAIREHYPLSIHGVGLSLAGAEPLNEAHLARLADLVERYEPQAVSEHLAWSTHAGAFLDDLLPLPYTHETLARICDNIDRVQSALRRPMLLENPATYLAFAEGDYDEPEFISEVFRRTGCGLLLDVSNVHVSCINHARDRHDYLQRLPLERVGEIHLAGFATREDAGGHPLLIDSHDRAVDEVVWKLYGDVLRLIGPQPTLIERDADIPAWGDLAAEARRAETAMLLYGRERPHAFAG